MIIDDVTIKVKAGKGGNGSVHFSRNMMHRGPTGGDGGVGGSVILRGVADLGALRAFRNSKEAKADNGKDGAQSIKTGSDGKDAVIFVPVGTVAHDLTNKKTWEISHVGQEEKIARGGNGGFGNFHFRSSRNTTPESSNPGELGEEIELRLELKMIADVGFVGKPNIGKSTLLNELTNASSRVANYKFTTLEPHLGVFFDKILADIPGLIEGAAEGKGLGHKFLRHIERTRALFHFVGTDSEEPVGDYLAIRKELEAFNPELSEKTEWVIVSKADERTEEEVAEIIEKLKKYNPNVIPLSILDEKSVGRIKKILLEEIEK